VFIRLVIIIANGTAPAAKEANINVMAWFCGSHAEVVSTKMISLDVLSL